MRFKRDLWLKRYNVYSKREVVVRECQKERMSFKRNYAGVYGNKSYERERESAH